MSIRLKDRERAWKRVAGFIPDSVGNDWPGTLASIIFFKGCNYRCPTCHNASFSYGKESKTPSEFTREYILSELKNNLDFVKHVVISGGEASIIDGIEHVFKDIQDLGISVKLDTNGSNPDMVINWVHKGLLNMVAVDIKGPYTKYPELTGSCCDPCVAQLNITSFLNLQMIFPHAVYFRTTRVPSLDEEDYKEIKSNLPSYVKHFYQLYVAPNEHNQCAIDGITEI
jgi:pyruvate formate lyase activating enzyme